MTPQKDSNMRDFFHCTTGTAGASWLRYLVSHIQERHQPSAHSVSPINPPPWKLVSGDETLWRMNIEVPRVIMSVLVCRRQLDYAPCQILAVVICLILSNYFRPT